MSTTELVALLVVLGAVALFAWRRLGSERRRPIPRVPHVEGMAPPGPGWTLVKIQDEPGLFWVEARLLIDGPVRNTLSDEQVARIRAFKERLGELEPSSIERTLDSFSRDAHPDGEIALWERIADVVEGELAARGFVERDQQRLIFEAVLTCANTQALVDVVLGVRPQLLALEGLEQVVERWRTHHRPS